MFFSDDARISWARECLQGEGFYQAGDPAHLAVKTYDGLSGDALVLKDLLLSYGGTSVLIPENYEPDAKKILHRGVLLDGSDCYMMLGSPNQCHSNAAHLWDNNRDKVLLCTGYALSPDGIWRQHSWCVELCEEPSVVETTEPRIAYFGFGMTQEEAELFLYENY